MVQFVHCIRRALQKRGAILSPLKARRITAAVVALLGFCVVASPVGAVTPTDKVRFYMNMGPVEIEMYGTQSPLNVANFMSYLNSGAYNDSLIHRTRDGTNVAGSELFAQGGSYKSNSLNGIPTGAAVNNEFNSANGLSNTKYTLAAAQSNGINSATSGWFINQTNNAAAFDPGKYTIMGKVTLGTSIIDTIPFLPNLPILTGTQLESMPIYNNGEVIINRAVRIPVVAGDYNFSGAVSSADYTTWRSAFGGITGTSTSTGNAAADGNANGFVDASDYVLWRKALPVSGAQGLAGDISVPEPASVLLMLFGGMMLGFSLRRSARRPRKTC